MPLIPDIANYVATLREGVAGGVLTYVLIETIRYLRNDFFAFFEFSKKKMSILLEFVENKITVASPFGG